MIEGIITGKMWPWALVNQPNKDKELEVILGSSTPDITNDELSGSNFNPNSDVSDISSDWEEIQKKVNQQIAEK